MDCVTHATYRQRCTVNHILWHCRRTQPLWSNWSLPLPDSCTVTDCVLPVRELKPATFSALCAHGVIALQRWTETEKAANRPVENADSNTMAPRSRVKPVLGRSLGALPRPSGA
eukprot:335491-Amphidinium_carterae.1